LEAENTILTAANMTLTAQVANLLGGAAAGGTAGGSAGAAPGVARGGAGAAPLVTFAATTVMVNYQYLINYSAKVGMTICNKGCEKFTFNLNPKLKEDKHVYLAAVDNQAKLMRWHYCLGCLAFSKLKRLALMGRSLDNWPRSSLLPARDASLVR
jgi:hypothetical protein